MNNPLDAGALTLADIAAYPQHFSYSLTLPSGAPVLFRPLLPNDVTALAAFLGELSAQTRRFSTYSSYDQAAAGEMCRAIARYDKLRLVAIPAQDTRHGICALFELSLNLVPADLERYHGYGLDLDPGAVCRFGPCIADAYQNRGLGLRLWPIMADLARRFGRRRVILWGGVLAGNARAIHYYQKLGFRHHGAFENSAGQLCYDMSVVFAEKVIDQEHDE
ncbi:MAG: GNAT family N-acetyltransferase [Anaerolineae bacterium]|nr:GNAT family N-acetyltransferase [Anaerolineae bacterium]